MKKSSLALEVVEHVSKQGRRRVRDVAVAACCSWVVALAAGCSGGEGEQTWESVPPDSIGEAKTALTTGQPVTTQRVDNLRTGTTVEPAGSPLTHATVGTNFGLVMRKTVRGAPYAQPLYLPNVASMKNAVGNKNVVFVATMHNQIYAFDADSPTAAPFWAIKLSSANSIRIPDPEFVGPLGVDDYRDITAEIGIVSTPVIDNPAGGPVMYVVATSKSGSTYKHELLKINARTGVISSRVTVAGTGNFSARHNQRTSLLLQNAGTTKVIYVGFGGYADHAPFAGHLFAFRDDLAPLNSWITTKGSGSSLNAGGIWMAGQGLLGDGSDVFFVTGNGDHTWNTANKNDMTNLRLGQSVVKMGLVENPPGTWKFQSKSWFSPHNWEILSSFDGDIGAAGVTKVPVTWGTTEFVVAGGKEGVLYVLDKSALGYDTASANTTDPNAFQRFRIRSKPNGCGATGLEHDYISLKCNHIHGAPVFYKDPTGKVRMYVWAENDVMRAFTWKDATPPLLKPEFDCGGQDPCDPTKIMTPPAPGVGQIDGNQIYGMPGGFLSVSYKTGNTDPIIWASHPMSLPNTVGGDDSEENAGDHTTDGVLVAYNANNLNEVWNSEKNAERDDSGAFVKFVPPTVTGGHAFLSGNNGVSNKVIASPGVTTDRGPALAVRTDGSTSGQLVYAYKTKPASGESGSIKVMQSNNLTGKTFTAPANLPLHVTKYEPALVGDNANRVFLAYTSSTTNKVVVLRSNDATFSAPVVIGTPSTDTTNAGPALAFGNGKVFLAWKEGLLGRLRVTSVAAGGGAFAPEVQLNGDGSDTTPSLYYSGSRLYLVWRGPDGNLNINWSANDGATWTTGGATNKTVYTYPLGQGVGSGPTLIGLPTSAETGTVTDLYMFFSNNNDVANKNLAVMTAEGSVSTAFGYEHRMFDIQTQQNPATTVWRNRVFVAWTDYSNRPWIGRYSPGELVAYGDSPPAAGSL